MVGFPHALQGMLKSLYHNAPTSFQAPKAEKLFLLQEMTTALMYFAHILDAYAFRDSYGSNLNLLYIINYEKKRFF